MWVLSTCCLQCKTSPLRLARLPGQMVLTVRFQIAPVFNLVNHPLECSRLRGTGVSMSCRYHTRRALAVLFRFTRHRRLTPAGAWATICTLEPAGLLSSIPSLLFLTVTFLLGELCCILQSLLPPEFVAWPASSIATLSFRYGNFSRIGVAVKHIYFCRRLFFNCAIDPLTIDSTSASAGASFVPAS